MNGVIIQARMGSTRLPGKVFLPLGDMSVLGHVALRARSASGVDLVVIATSTNPEDDRIAEWCKEMGYACYRGSSSDVLSRYYEAASMFKCDTIIRVTSDCPLIAPEIIGEVLAAFRGAACDYISNINGGPRTFPRGLDVEVFSYTALEKAHQEATAPYEREHVTPYIWENKKGSFALGSVVNASPEYARTGYRLTLDYPEDYELFQKLYTELYTPGAVLDTRTALRYLDQHPEVVAINAFREQDHLKIAIQR